VKRRPALLWHGGKWLLAPWIISHFPPHRTYVEPFGGAASVLLRKSRASSEVYNDADGEIVNFFRILRDPALADRLRARLELTPFARDEQRAAYERADDAVERARRFIVRSFMGHSSVGAIRESPVGFRINSNTSLASGWASWPQQVPTLVERLRGVAIENADGAVVMRRYDSPSTLFYVDPPYLPSTRRLDRVYRHEMGRADHVRLLDQLRSLEGMIALSGYPSALYDEVLSGWDHREADACAYSGAIPTRERLWLNPACAKALGSNLLSMIDMRGDEA
jgi:DNA adenine methylase